MRRLLTPVLLLALTLPLFAATRESHTVEVIQVPVYVTRDGASVAGLTRDNFELYVNGKAKAFDYFDVYDFAAPAPAASTQEEAAAMAPVRDVRQRRLYVLLFDLVYSTPKAIARARVAADSYVDQAGPADAFAVGKYTSNHGIELFVPFTRDREAARNAIQRMSEGRNGDPLHLALAPVERAEIVQADKFGESDQAAQFIADSAAAQLVLDPTRRRIRDQMDALGDLADRLAILEGNRHVVLLTSGFNTGALHGVGPANTIVSPVNFGPNGQMNRPLRQGSNFGMSDPGVTGAAREMYGRFTRAGVFLDCIDVEGARLEFSGTHDSEGLSMLARDTGGQVVLNHNDLKQAMQTLSDMQRVVYVLGFHAPDTGARDNKIEVKLRNVGGAVRVNFRPSYSTAPLKASTTDALRIADILENDIPQTGVTTSVSTSGKRVDVEIPARELIALSAKPNTDADALVYVFSGRGVVAFKGKKISIDAARADAAKPVHLAETFDDLPPGHYVAKVLLRVDGTDALGFGRALMNVD